jgi:hypothetical protein
MSAGALGIRMAVADVEVDAEDEADSTTRSIEMEIEDESNAVTNGWLTVFPGP